MYPKVLEARASGRTAGRVDTGPVFGIPGDIEYALVRFALVIDPSLDDLQALQVIARVSRATGVLAGADQQGR